MHGNIIYYFTFSDIRAHCVEERVFNTTFFWTLRTILLNFLLLIHDLHK